MPISPSARRCTPLGWTGCPRRWPGSIVACSTGSAMRWPAPHPSCVTHQGRTSRPIRMAAARSSWCWMASSRTSMATFPPAAISVTRPPRRIRPLRRWVHDLRQALAIRSGGSDAVRIDTGALAFVPALAAGRRGGATVSGPAETVRLERWQPSAEIELAVPGGIEVLVLDGGFSEGGESFEPQSWLRLPRGATAAGQGCGCGPVCTRSGSRRASRYTIQFRWLIPCIR